MAYAKIARLKIARAQLEAMERQEAKREAYLRGVRRAQLLEKYFRLGVAYAAGILTCQFAYLVLL